MLLFVVAALTIFHFALPHGDEPTRPRSACSGSALDLHGAARPDARVRRRARAGDVRRARARAVRPQRDLARQGARRARVPRRAPRSSRCRRSPRSSPASTAARSPRSRWRTSASRPSGTLFGAMAVAGRARELLLPLLFLPMAIPIVVGGVGGVPLVPRCSTTRSSRCSAGPRSSTSSRRPRAAGLRCAP